MPPAAMEARARECSRRPSDCRDGGWSTCELTSRCAVGAFRIEKILPSSRISDRRVLSAPPQETRKIGRFRAQLGRIGRGDGWLQCRQAACAGGRRGRPEARRGGGLSNAAAMPPAGVRPPPSAETRQHSAETSGRQADAMTKVVWWAARLLCQHGGAGSSRRAAERVAARAVQQRLLL